MTLFVKKCMIFLLRAYQLCLSPFLGNQCRFYPSCSNYAIDAMTYKGIFQGLFLIVKRIIKCNGFHPGGYDPVQHEEEQEGGKKQDV